MRDIFRESRLSQFRFANFFGSCVVNPIKSQVWFILSTATSRHMADRNWTLEFDIGSSICPQMKVWLLGNESPPQAMNRLKEGFPGMNHILHLLKEYV